MFYNSLFMVGPALVLAYCLGDLDAVRETEFVLQHINERWTFLFGKKTLKNFKSRYTISHDSANRGFMNGLKFCKSRVKKMTTDRWLVTTSSVYFLFELCTNLPAVAVFGQTPILTYYYKRPCSFSCPTLKTGRIRRSCAPFCSRASAVSF